METALPPGFTDLYTASSRHNVDFNLMGVVVDFLPPSRSRGTDWMCTFSIADSTVGGHDDGLRVRFFRPTQTELPHIRGTGDVVVLRNVKVKQWNGMTIAMSSWGSSWIVFPASAIPTKAPSNYVLVKHLKDIRAPAASISESLYAISLCNSQDRSRFTAPVELNAQSISTSPSLEKPSSSMVSVPRQKFCLIENVEIDRFYDLVGQVIKLYPNNGCTELYITDYTTNNLLYAYEWGRDGEGSSRDGDPYGYHPRASNKWRGPCGKMTLTVTLWPPHCHFAHSHVKEDDFLHLRNVRVKYSADSKVEGTLHTDKRYPDRIDITVLKDHQDDRVKDVLRRKREYAKRFESQRQAFEKDARGEKRKQNDEGEVPSKVEAKRRRRKQQKQQGQAQKAVEGKQNVDESSESVVPKDRLNKNISSTNPSIPPRPLSAILSLETHHITTPTGTPHTLPFQNICSRATVRVIDFFPPNLEDFAAPQRPSEFDVLSDAGSDSDSGYDTTPSSPLSSADEKPDLKWEWRFYLLVEDAAPIPKREKPPKMKLLVADQDAEFLLRLDAENLRTNPKALARLREKLFILWGDLEERKPRNVSSAPAPRHAHPSSKRSPGRDWTKTEDAQHRALPFQCCVKEYGVRRKEARSGWDAAGGDDEDQGGGWERRFRMFGTTVS
ncbi:Telomeric single stranded DNA binding POT1/Cdc13 [Lasallia pustulata]|uniref:Protection of telomeres protein 1 n=1 Tax=Lasallia pustulata TaxID=136370 RepID=A0A1W5D5J9_9LECA|nr:Telomeric single stranded DNA binding POT1/Cdc13 [Lasallia pustulata]